MRQFIIYLVVAPILVVAAALYILFSEPKKDITFVNGAPVMTDKLEESQKNNILDKIPMKKFGIPDDVANLVYFLSSDKSSYITGQNFNVNGGMLMF